MRVIVSRLRNLPSPARLAWCAAAAMAVLSVAAACAHLFVGMNSDTFLLTHQTQKMLEGGEPYVAFADLNPPLINLLYTLPVSLAMAFDWPMHVPLNLLALALVAASLAVSERILRHSQSSGSARAVVISALAVALLGISFINHVYADREHLMVVLVAPLLLLYSPLVQRKTVPLKWRVAAAAMAGVGFAIKFYFYVVYAAVLAFTVLCQRPLRMVVREIEHYVIAAVALAYLAVIFLFFPVYVSTIFPLVWETYRAFSISWERKVEILTIILKGYVLPGLAIVVLAPMRWNRTILYLLVLLLAAIASFWTSGGWAYTYYPFVALGWMLAIAVMQALFERYQALERRSHKLRQIMAMAVAASVIWQYGLYPIYTWIGIELKFQTLFGYSMKLHHLTNPSMKALMAHVDSHPRYLFLTETPRGLGLLKKGTKSVGRFDSLWMLAGIMAMKERNDASYAAFSEYVTTSVAEDIEKYAPDMVIINDSPYKPSLPGHFSLLDFFLANERFARAFENYILADRINMCTHLLEYQCAYQVYYRRAP